MLITSEMNLDDLQSVMGDATMAEAEEMKELLVSSGWVGWDTSNVHEGAWGTLLDMAFKNASNRSKLPSKNLIAAAPELLEAAKSLAVWLEHFRDEGKQLGNLDMSSVDRLRAAIAKCEMH